MFCALSGEPPQTPVLSPKSGHVYERRLIEKYIADNGTDPSSGDKLAVEDLITIKTCVYPLLYLSSLGSHDASCSTSFRRGTSPTRTDVHSCAPAHTAE